MGKILILLLFLTACSNQKEEIVNEYYILTEEDLFSEEQLIEEIKMYNFKYPHIILAQAILESGNFTSNVFESHNNMFGMKIAKSRITCAQKDVGDYAYYNDWKMSLVDRALYETTYLRKSKSEDDYLKVMCASYAEDVEYRIKLQKVVDIRELKSKF